MMPIESLTELNIGGQSLPVPVYFPSVSSIKTTLMPHDYLQFLSSLVSLNGQFLVSAFDLASIANQSSVKEMLATARQSGVIILMDSGNYESFWKDAQGSWRQANYHNILKDFPCDLAFGFDEQSPPDNNEEHVDLIIERWRADQEVAGKCQVIPIIHAAASELPVLCAAIAAEIDVTILAVAERRLGDGVLERVRTVQAIRAELDKLGRHVALHLLGTGNPISIAMYSAMGANSFDGLEWCQTVVDHETALLYHLSQADFFAGQTSWGEAGLSFQARTLAHNLEFYTDWMSRLRSAINQGCVSDFCRANLPSRAFKYCANAAGWSL